MSDLIRVSSVLKILYPHSLDYIDQADLDRGSRLHFAMQCYVNDRLHGVSNINYPEISTMVTWLDDNQVEVESAEERFEDAKLGFCGHPDLLGIWKGVPCVFDYKYAESLTEQNRMQMEGYRHLTKRRPILLQCPKSGIVKAIRCKPNPQLWAAFLNGLGVAKFHQSRQAKQLKEEPCLPN